MPRRGGFTAKSLSSHLASAMIHAYKSSGSRKKILYSHNSFQPKIPLKHQTIQTLSQQRGMNMSQEEEELKQAIALINTGKKTEGVLILKSIIKTNRNNELAWLWLSYCAEKPEDKIFCFREALRINPNNEQTKKALVVCQFE
jgi:tetratricopeptide (TPR) repeat protein